jgi:hypothetical protein
MTVFELEKVKPVLGMPFAVDWESEQLGQLDDAPIICVAVGYAHSQQLHWQLTIGVGGKNGCGER